MADRKAIVLVEPDGFIGTAQRVSSYIPSWNDTPEDVLKKREKAAATQTDTRDLTHVSRPLNGISVKPNTYAYVQVIREDGTAVKVFNRLGQGLGKAGKHGNSHDGFQSGGYNNDVLDTNYQWGLAGPPPDGTDEKYDGLAGAAQYETDKLAWEAKVKGSDTEIEAAMKAGKIPALPEGWENKDPDGNPNSTAWTDWILQAVREQRVEKTQVVETFGDTYLYAFGERPRALEFKGLLMNSLDYNWRAVFWENWDKFFRATKLIEQNCRMYIGWEDIIVEGYPLNASAAETADSPNAMTFSFTFYVTNYINTSAQGGFTDARKNKIATIRGGLESYWAQRLTDIPDKRNYGLNWLGTHGVDTLGGLAEDFATLPALGGWGGAIGRFAGDTVRSAGDAVLKGAMAYMIGEKTGNLFMKNYLRSLTYNSLKFWTDIGKGELEAEFNFKRGEVDAWFGFMGNILSRVKWGEPDEPTYKGNAAGIENRSNVQWIGDSAADYGNNAYNAIKKGGIDAIIQSLAYAAVGADAFAVDGYDTAFGSRKTKDGYFKDGGVGKPKPATALTVTLTGGGSSILSGGGGFLSQLTSGATGTNPAEALDSFGNPIP